MTAGGVVNGTYGVLTVTNTAGNYTWSYTLSDNTLAHTDTVVDANSDRGADDQVFDNFSVDVTDSDGDHAILDTLNIAINDDGPTTITPTSLLLPNAAGGPFTGFLDADINIDDNVGADQPGTISFANIINGDQAVGIVNGSTANLTSGGQNIHLYLVNQDSSLTTPDQLQGWIGGAPRGGPGCLNRFSASMVGRGYLNR